MLALACNGKRSTNGKEETETPREKMQHKSTTNNYKTSYYTLNLSFCVFVVCVAVFFRYYYFCGNNKCTLAFVVYKNRIFGSYTDCLCDSFACVRAARCSFLPFSDRLMFYVLISFELCAVHALLIRLRLVCTRITARHNIFSRVYFAWKKRISDAKKRAEHETEIILLDLESSHISANDRKIFINEKLPQINVSLRT